MVNWTVTPYLTFAEAQAAQQAIGNGVFSTVVPFMEANKQKFALVSSNAPIPAVLTGNPLTTDLKLRVCSIPYGYDVVEGNIPNHETFSKMGFNPDVDSSEEDIWYVGGLYIWPTAEMRMEIVSSSADDAAEGTGARTVRIRYLTRAFVEKSEDIALNGVTPVPTVATDIYRINWFRVLTAGSGGKAAGDLDLRHLDNTPIYSRIPAGLTRARNAMYTVPANKILFITQLTYSTGNSQGGRFCRFSLRSNYEDLSNTLTGNVFYPYSEIGVQDGAFTITYDVPMKFIAGADIKVSATGDATNADALCSVQYRGWLEVA
jgi:hypothetical protein